MRVLASIVLTLALSIPATACARQTAAPVVPVTDGYDVGSCASGQEFYAVHFVTDGDNFKLTQFIDEPNKVKVLAESILFKFTKEDKLGKHYISGDDSDMEIVLTFKDHTVTGLIFEKGKITSMLLGLMSSGGKKLAENSPALYTICQEILKDDEPKADPKDDPKKKSKTEDRNTQEWYLNPRPVVKI